MKDHSATSLAACLALAVTQTALAGTDTFFTPLTESAQVTLPDSDEEINAPWVVPPGVTQNNLTSMVEIEADIKQSVVRAPGAGTQGSMWDMVSFDSKGENIFIPHEAPWGAGGSRYNIKKDKNDVLFSGDSGGMNEDWSRDWGAFDPSTYTPNGTVFFAEEWTAEGRVLEVLNPHAKIDDIRVRELESIANVSHEGLRFSADGKTLYFVDEWNSGAIYKIRFRNKSRYGRGGQTFVLAVNAFDGDPAANYNEGVNPGKTRVGMATWVPITNKNGIPITISNPYRNGPTDDPRTNPNTRGGRAAADEVNGTPYGRPEDIEVGKLKNGKAVIYFCATSEQTIYSIEELGHRNAMVRVFASESVTPKNLGYPATTGTLNSPDNLAQDALGNIFVVEDAPNSSDTGGDIWFARDVNGDGVAESLDHFMSNRVEGSESTGMIFNPAKPTRFVMAIQHPDSTDIPGGTGDALWSFNLRNVELPAACNDEPARSQNSGCNYVRLLFATQLGI
ncbi:MAG: alkaline phosphatase PhoX [Methylococcales bacterium]